MNMLTYKIFNIVIILGFCYWCSIFTRKYKVANVAEGLNTYAAYDIS